MGKKRSKIIFLFTLIILLPLLSWGQSNLVLVEIADDPAVKIKKLLPFVNYIATNLKDEGIEKGEVIIVASIQEAAKVLSSGEADLFIDSPYPIVAVSQLSGSKFLLRRWKKGVSEYNSVIFTRKDSGIKTIQDLYGKMISFEVRSSTSGYFLPKVALLESGLKMTEKRNVKGRIASDEIGYTFSEGDETTMVWVLRKRVAAGAIDFPNYIADSRTKKDELMILYQTENIPRQVVSHRGDLSPALVSKMKDVLLNMHLSEEGKTLLKDYSATTKFDELPSQSMDLLLKFKNYIKAETDG